MSVTQTNARIAHCQIGFSLCRRNEAKQKKQYLGQTIFEYSIEVLVSSQRHVENCPEAAIFTLSDKAGVCCGPCNPSKWEAEL